MTLLTRADLAGMSHYARLRRQMRRAAAVRALQKAHHSAYHRRQGRWCGCRHGWPS